MTPRRRVAQREEPSQAPPVVHCIREQRPDKSKIVYVTKCGETILDDRTHLTTWWCDVTCLACRPFGWETMPMWEGGPLGAVMVDRRTGERQTPPEPEDKPAPAPLVRRRRRVSQAPR